jgi:hypothetical protein
MDNGSSSSGDESADAHDEDSKVHRDIRRPAAASAAAGNAIPCELHANTVVLGNFASSSLLLKVHAQEKKRKWHRNRYRRWQEEQQGLRPALLMLVS